MGVLLYHGRDVYFNDIFQHKLDGGIFHASHGALIHKSSQIDNHKYKSNNNSLLLFEGELIGA